MNGEQVASSILGGDAVIVVPPFGGLDRPSLAAHLLQACAARVGVRVSVFYANLLLAAQIGESPYSAVCYAPCSALLGERFFAAAAYGVPLLGRDEGTDPGHFVRSADDKEAGPTLDELRVMAEGAERWADLVAEAVTAKAFAVVGCTTTFEQTAASLAVLTRVKERRPETLTILGGANCEGAMAEGLRALGSGVDYIFSGESEETYPAFLRHVLAGAAPPRGIVHGSPCADMDALPTPCFDEFYQQLRQFLPDSRLAESIWLPFETSRGCWWGAKKHCTFCGLNAQTMAHRAKSADRVIQELSELLRSHPTRKVCMVDNIMPYTYFKTLLPRLPSELPGLHIFYEQKSNLSLADVVALKDAGVPVIQPGIEALSTSLLKRMEKGVTARQNVALLRYARAAELALNWNLLFAFPGDLQQDYEETLELIPLISHLNPPGGLYHLSIDRFSPYFDRAPDFGVRDLRPLDSYAAVLPDGAPAEEIAYHFTARYASGILERPDLIRELDGAVKRWKALWEIPDQPPPSLAVEALSEDEFILLDTRRLEGTEDVQFLTRAEAHVVLRGGRLDAVESLRWALDRKLLAKVDSRYVPLAVAAPDLLAEVEQLREEPAPSLASHDRGVLPLSIRRDAGTR